MRVSVIAGVVAVIAAAVVGSSTTASSVTTPKTSRVGITNSSGNGVVGVANYQTGRSRLWANWDLTGNADLGLTPGEVPMESVEARGVSYLKTPLVRRRSLLVEEGSQRGSHDGEPRPVGS